MSNLPLVTVLTPVYNAEDHVTQCIESVIAQTYEHWEYTIVDNCSTDRTPQTVQALARRDPRIRYVRCDEFIDVVASYNRTLAHAGTDGAYLKILGADDMLYPTCLERMVQLAEANHSVGVVSAFRIDESTVDLVGIPEDKTVLPGAEILRQSLRGGPYVTGSATSSCSGRRSSGAEILSSTLLPPRRYRSRLLDADAVGLRFCSRRVDVHPSAEGQ